MNEQRIALLLTAKNQASQEVKKLSGDVSNLGQSGEKSMGGLGEIFNSLPGPVRAFGAAVAGIGLAQLALDAGQAVVELAKLGAENQRLAQSYGVVTAQAGIASDELLSSLRRSAQGTISDTNLMLNANRALLLGVADNTDELSRLLEVAAARGKTLGLSTEQAFSDLVVGIGRVSPLILDNLGIVTGGEKVFNDYAASIGKTTDSLTENERKQALVNKVIAESATLTKSLGQSADDPAASFERMNASIQNAKVALGELFAPAVAVVAENIALAAQAASAGLKAVAAAGTLPAETTATFGQSVAALTTNLQAGNISLAAHAQQLYDLIGRLEITDDATFNTAFQLENLARAAQDGTISYEEYIRQVINLTTSQVGLTGAIAAAVSTYPAAGSGMMGLAAGASAASSMQRGLNVEVSLGSIELNKLAREFGNALAQSDRFTNGANRSAMALGNVHRNAIAAASGLIETARGYNIAEAAANAATAAAANFAAAQGAMVAGIASQLVTTEGAGGAIAAYKQMNAQVSAQVDLWEQTGYSMEEIESVLLPGYVSGLRKSTSETVKLASGTGVARQAVAQLSQAYTDLQSKVSGVVSGALGDDLGGIKLDSLLPRQDSVAEDARRLADVAVNGFNSPWASYFQQKFPELFSEISSGGDIKTAAAQVLRDFQDGLRPELLDKGRAKEIVKRAILGDQNTKALVDEISKELATELGVSIQEAQKAATAALGGGGILDGAIGSSTGDVSKLSIKPEIDTVALSATKIGLTATIFKLTLSDDAEIDPISLTATLFKLKLSDDAELPDLSNLSATISDLRVSETERTVITESPLSLTGWINKIGVNEGERTRITESALSLTGVVNGVQFSEDARTYAKESALSLSGVIGNVRFSDNARTYAKESALSLSGVINEVHPDTDYFAKVKGEISKLLTPTISIGYDDAPIVADSEYLASTRTALGLALTPTVTPVIEVGGDTLINNALVYGSNFSLGVIESIKAFDLAGAIAFEMTGDGKSVFEAGKFGGTQYAHGFLEVFGGEVPQQVLMMLATLVAPMVAAMSKTADTRKASQ